VIGHITFLLFLLLSLVSATSLILRLRRAIGDERAQLKWFAYIAAILAVLFAAYNLANILSFFLTAALNFTAVINVAFALFYPLALASLPLLTGLAILKYRLYDIDMLINRTLVYSALTACVVGLYVLVVGGLGALLQTQGSL